MAKAPKKAITKRTFFPTAQDQKNMSVCLRNGIRAYAQVHGAGYVIVVETKKTTKVGKIVFPIHTTDWSEKIYEVYRVLSAKYKGTKKNGTKSLPKKDSQARSKNTPGEQTSLFSNGSKNG